MGVDREKDITTWGSFFVPFTIRGRWNRIKSKFRENYLLGVDEPPN